MKLFMYQKLFSLTNSIVLFKMYVGFDIFEMCNYSNLYLKIDNIVL